MTKNQSIKNRLEQLSFSQRKCLANKLSPEKQPKAPRLMACITVNANITELDGIKAFAKSQLPDHCIPQSMLIVSELPRKVGGKVNRDKPGEYSWSLQNTLSQTDNKSMEASGVNDEDPFASLCDFVPPRNDVEHALARIWGEVLGCGDIGIHDHFFEVGGDSLLSIRILARANKAGLSISTQDFFDHPTIAEQARLVAIHPKDKIKEGKLTGPFSITPIQDWFFTHIKGEQHHWNQNILLAAGEKLNFLSLERTVQKLLLHHDGLRSLFYHNGSLRENDWQQEIKDFQSQLPLHRLDLSDLDEAEIAGIVESKAQDLNQSLKLQQGSLIKFLFIKTASGVKNQLLIIAHHLIVDAQSWRILLEDVKSLWQAFSAEHMPSLPDKTHSFKRWSECLNEYAHSENLLAQQAYWAKQESISVMPIPVDFSTEIQSNCQQSQAEHKMSLSAQQTQELIGNSMLNLASVKEALITAIVCSFSMWSKQHTLRIDIEGHGREHIQPGIDVSRTIGWFTTVYPVVFESLNIDTQFHNANTLLNQVKATLKDIPQNGIGYGVIKSLLKPRLEGNRSESERVDTQPQQAEICFNYLGQLDKLNSDLDANGSTDSTSIALLAENIGTPRSPAGTRAYLIEINAMIENGVLKVIWHYSKHVHTEKTVSEIANHFLASLTQLIHLSKAESSEQSDLSGNTISQSSFDLVDLDEDELTRIANLLSEADE